MVCMHMNDGMWYSAVNHLITVTSLVQNANFNESETKGQRSL